MRRLLLSFILLLLILLSTSEINDLFLWNWGSFFNFEVLLMQDFKAAFSFSNCKCGVRIESLTGINSNLAKSQLRSTPVYYSQRPDLDQFPFMNLSLNNPVFFVAGEDLCLPFHLHVLQDPHLSELGSWHHLYHPWANPNRLYWKLLQYRFPHLTSNVFNSEVINLWNYI